MQTRQALFILAVVALAPALARALPLPPVEAPQAMSERDFRAAVDAEKGYIRDIMHDANYSIYIGLARQACLYMNPSTSDRGAAAARMEFYVRRRAYEGALRQAQRAQRVMDSHRDSSAVMGIPVDPSFEQSQSRAVAQAVLVADRAAAAALGAREAYQAFGGDMRELALNETELAARTSDYRAGGCPLYD